MIDIKKVSINLQATLQDAIEVINKGKIQIALVVDDKERFVGVINDGDVRRFFSKNIKLSTKVSELVKKDSKTLRVGYTKEEVLNSFSEYLIKQIPILDDECRVVEIQCIDDYLDFQKTRVNKTIIMVGGLGQRLHPLTKDTPKPMLKIGNKPILEIIINNCYKYGFRDIILAINYKANIIKEYFGDGSRFGVKIQYILEDKRMGIAGALSLIEQTQLNEPFIVMNGDLLTKLDLGKMIEYHYKNNAIATMGVKEYDFQVPYGVINTQNNHILSIDEKPVHQFFINAGIYIMNPSVLQYIPQNEYFDMNQLFTTLIDKHSSVLKYQINEYWMDIGHMKDYQQANIDFWDVFDAK